MSESSRYNEIRRELQRYGARVFRNQGGRYQLKDGRWLSSGLCVGASDLIGWTRDGRFLAVEVKSPGGRLTPEQERFLGAVRDAGGVAFSCHTAEEAGTLLGIESAGTATVTLED